MKYKTVSNPTNTEPKIEQRGRPVILHFGKEQARVNRLNIVKNEVPGNT